MNCVVVVVFFFGVIYWVYVYVMYFKRHVCVFSQQDESQYES